MRRYTARSCAYVCPTCNLIISVTCHVPWKRCFRWLVPEGKALDAAAPDKKDAAGKALEAAVLDKKDDGSAVVQKSGAD